MRRLIATIRRRLLPAAPRPLVLVYHRIAAPRVDPWELAVHPDRFEQHLAVLRRSRRVLPMSELVHRLQRRTLPGNAVGITFDDGYVDTLHEAKPRLAAAGFPATLFVVTGAVGQEREYWWDELARGILLGRGAVDERIEIAGEDYRLLLPENDGTRCSWRAREGSIGPREGAYLAIWDRLRKVSAAVRDTAMNCLRARLDFPPPHPQDCPMTASEIAELAADGVFEIGGHTVTHPVLTLLEPEERRDEIRQSRLACERIVNRSIAGFAYPHGVVDAGSRQAVKECGFSWACSTEPRSLYRRCDLYALPRLWVQDWDGDTFERALQAVSA